MHSGAPCLKPGIASCFSLFGGIDCFWRSSLKMYLHSSAAAHTCGLNALEPEAGGLQLEVITWEAESEFTWFTQGGLC